MARGTILRESSRSPAQRYQEEDAVPLGRAVSWLLLIASVAALATYLINHRELLLHLGRYTGAGP